MEPVLRQPVLGSSLSLHTTYDAERGGRYRQVWVKFAKNIPPELWRNWVDVVKRWLLVSYGPSFPPFGLSVPPNQFQPCQSSVSRSCLMADSWHTTNSPHCPSKIVTAAKTQHMTSESWNVHIRSGTLHCSIYVPFLMLQLSGVGIFHVNPRLLPTPVERNLGLTWKCPTCTSSLCHCRYVIYMVVTCYLSCNQARHARDKQTSDTGILQSQLTSQTFAEWQTKIYNRTALEITDSGILRGINR